MKLFLFAFALISIVVSAAPAPAPTSCSLGVPKVIADIIHILPNGTPFCSSYLSIPTITNTVSKTVAITTVYKSTITSTLTHLSEVTATSIVPLVLTTTTGTDFVVNTETETTTSTSVVNTHTVSPITITSNAPTPTSTITTTTILTQSYFVKYPPPSGNTQRDLDERGISIPAPLISYAKAEISSACSCLNLPTSTVTSTRSVTQTVSALATTSAGVTSTNFVDVTSTNTIYSKVADLKTIDTTAIIVDIFTSTSVQLSSITTTTTITPAAVTETATSTITSVVTVTTDPCDPTTGVKYTKEAVYNYGDILHTGYTAVDLYDGDLSPAGCCRQCYNTPGCVISFSIENYQCELMLNNIKPVVGANAQCPTGYDVVDVFGGASVGLPPSGDPIDNQIPWVAGPCFSGTVVD